MGEAPVVVFVCLSLGCVPCLPKWSMVSTLQSGHTHGSSSSSSKVCSGHAGPSIGNASSVTRVSMKWGGGAHWVYGWIGLKWIPIATTPVVPGPLRRSTWADESCSAELLLRIVKYNVEQPALYCVIIHSDYIVWTQVFLNTTSDRFSNLRQQVFEITADLWEKMQKSWPLTYKCPLTQPCCSKNIF